MLIKEMNQETSLLAIMAVICPAALVARTGQAWPDLSVAAIIALLFLLSAYLIVQDSFAELAATDHQQMKRETE